MSSDHDNLLSSSDRELIDAYLDGVATEAQTRALETRLATVPAAAAELLALSRLECTVKQVHQRPAHTRESAAPACVRIATPAAIAVFGLAAAGVAALLTKPHNDSLAARYDLPFSAARQAPDARRTAGGPDALIAHPVRPATSERLAAFDFDHAIDTYPRWDRADVADCPPGREGKRCLNGIRMSLRQDQLGVTLGDWRRPFLEYQPGLRIRFAAWVGQNATKPRFAMHVVLFVGAGKDGEDFLVNTEVSAALRWIDIEVSLDAARAPDTQQPLRPGDRITAIHITLPWRDNDVFFVDDFEIVRVTEPQ